MNAHSDIIVVPDRTTGQQSAETVNRLASELSLALNGYWNGRCTAVVMPDAASEYPIQVMLDRELNRTMEALFEYRRLYRAMMAKWEEFQQTPAGQHRSLAAAIANDTTGYFEAKHACDLAHARLVHLFASAQRIEGSTAA